MAEIDNTQIEELIIQGKRMHAVQLVIEWKNMDYDEANAYVNMIAARHRKQIEQESEGYVRSPVPEDKITEEPARNLFFSRLLKVMLLIFTIIIWSIPDFAGSFHFIGTKGLFLWALTYGRMNVLTILMLGWALVKLVKRQGTESLILNKIGNVCLAVVVFSIVFNLTGDQVIKAYHDLTQGPVEISIKYRYFDYVEMRVGRSSYTREKIALQYQLPPGEVAERIVLPLDSYELAQEGVEDDFPLTVLVYPNTGIIADQDSLDRLIYAMRLNIDVDPYGGY